MTNKELARKAFEVATNFKTLYVMGCFGAPMNAKNKNRYTKNHSYNKKPERTEMINGASEDTFGFDCVCFIKGLLWGWNGNTKHVYGGAKYKSNGVPDTTPYGFIKNCKDVSTDFSNIEVGEFLYMEGHCGLYVGNGYCVECTPSWDNGVQITNVSNVMNRKQFRSRKWISHGKLPFVEYV